MLSTPCVTEARLWPPSSLSEEPDPSEEASLFSGARPDHQEKAYDTPVMGAHPPNPPIGGWQGAPLTAHHGSDWYTHAASPHIDNRS